LVERVSNSLPHEQRTCATTYSGWMSVFMATPFARAEPARERAVRMREG
jgi:hypothetical protein